MNDTSTTYALELDGLVKRYRGFTLGSLDLKLDPGIVLGLIGHNGAGKTTALNVIVGLVKKDAGTVKIFGRDTNPNDIKWKLDIGYVGDTHVFYEYWSGERNLKFLSEFYPDWSFDRVDELAKRFQLDLKKRANQLSRGNRAKLALIAALAHNPKLLLLDEPTSGLDPLVRAEFLEALWEIMESGDAAVLYSTHILSDIGRLADEMAFLHDGKITLRQAKDDMIDHWRRISFVLSAENPNVTGAVSHVRDGDQHMIISSDFEQSINSLNESGVEHVETSMMTIEEIAVYVMKESV